MSKLPQQLLHFYQKIFLCVSKPSVSSILTLSITEISPSVLPCRKSLSFGPLFTGSLRPYQYCPTPRFSGSATLSVFLWVPVINLFGNLNISSPESVVEPGSLSYFDYHLELEHLLYTFGLHIVLCHQNTSVLYVSKIRFFKKHRR